MRGFEGFLCHQNGQRPSQRGRTGRTCVGKRRGGNHKHDACAHLHARNPYCCKTARDRPPPTPPKLATGGRVRSFVPGGEPLLRTRGMIGSRSVYGKAPMKKLHSKTIAVSVYEDAGQQINTFAAVIHMQESPPHKQFLVGCSSPFKRLAEHLALLRTWCWRCLPDR